MIDIFKLDLPSPSDTIISMAREFVLQQTYNNEAKEWLDNFHSNNVNSALHLFIKSASLTELIEKEYNNFFEGFTVTAGYGIIQNAKQVPACLPPHIDRARALAINYYLDLGGDNVSTVFYDLVTDTNVAESQNFRYSECKKVGSIVFKKNCWYAYDVCRCHSVENIIGQRFFIVVSINTAQLPRNIYRINNFANDFEKKVSFTRLSLSN